MIEEEKRIDSVSSYTVSVKLSDIDEASHNMDGRYFEQLVPSSFVNPLCGEKYEQEGSELELELEEAAVDDAQNELSVK